MPVIYLLTGVSSGSLAALSSILLGHPAAIALLSYALFGALCILALAMRLSCQRVAEQTE